MGKKIWYSKPLSEMWNQYKQFYKVYKSSVEDFFQMKNKQILTTSNQLPEDMQSHASILDLWYLDANKKFTHIYFKNKELRNFLAEMKLSNLEETIEFLYESGESFKYTPSYDGIHPLGKSENIQVVSFGIHIPYEKEDKGYAFQLLFNERKELDLIWAVGKNEGWCSAENYKNNLKSSDEHSDFFTYIFRLAINTIAYMKAFPECVTEGVPKTEFEECGYILEVSEKVLENTNIDSNKMISPHFRKGYWKLLKSDFYTHKKGQLVFVSETMVNGIAKTVEKSSDKEKLNSFCN